MSDSGPQVDKLPPETAHLRSRRTDTEPLLRANLRVLLALADREHEVPL